LFASEYYLAADGERLSRPVWLGLGAQALGLTPGADADAETLGRLLNGYGPNGEKLAQNAGRADRRLGHDLTFSADKSISILFAAASGEERERLLELHHRAGQAGLDFLQGEIKARRGHAGERSVAVAGLVVARVDHFSSRELQAQLHSHYCVANVALGADGKFSTFDAEAFESHKHAAGALYRAEMARGLQELGYNVASRRELDRDGRETGQIWHQVAGIEAPALEHFSKRSRQIKDWMEAHPGDSAQTACMRTRQGKEGGEPDAARIMQETGAELDEMRAAGAVTWATADDLKNVAGQEIDRRTDAAILENLHRNESAWGRAHLIDALAKERGPELGAQGVLTEADAFLARNALLELTPDRQGRPRWASQAQHDLEQGIADKATARADDRAVRVAPELVDAAIAAHEKEKGFTLNDEQRQAVRWATQETGGVACLTGRAGTGKTATAGAYIKAFEANGQRVLGACASWDAADKLAAETGLETRSTASLLWQLDAGKMKLTSRDVVMLDEAGMVGAKTVARLQEHINQAGGKLILAGDALQLQPVESGAAFRLAQSAVGHSELTEIRRQSDTRDRALAEAFYGKATGGEIVAQMKERGQMHAHDTTKDARQALASAYLADATPAREKLVIAGTNDGARAITASIRAGLKERGELQNSRPVAVAGALQNETRELDLAPGDRVRFGKRDKKMGVSNGSVGVVERIEDGKDGHRLAVRLESDIARHEGRLVEVDTGKYKALEHGYAGTVHKAQGQGRESVYWHAEGGSADRNLGLVAFTRMKAEIHAYSSEHGLEKLEKGLDDWRMKQNAAEMMAPAPQQAQGITTEQTKELGSSLSALLKQRGAVLVQTPPAMNHAAAVAEKTQEQKPPAPTPGPQAKAAAWEAEKAQRHKEERKRVADTLRPAWRAWSDAQAPLKTAEQQVKEAKAEQTKRQDKLAESQRKQEAATWKLTQSYIACEAWKKENPRKFALGWSVPKDLLEAHSKNEKTYGENLEKLTQREASAERQAGRVQKAEGQRRGAVIAARPHEAALTQARSMRDNVKARHKVENMTPAELQAAQDKLQKMLEKQHGANWNKTPNPWEPTPEDRLLVANANNMRSQQRGPTRTAAPAPTPDRGRDRGYGMSM
jgi:conjugative relaxase-like TrwC/TraI family protein